ncbi:hypothetical protein FGO68_gene14078 [Halteria grandinella]|uniref:Protein kinase domain-containing protein n=1 Tax=Halteria grandinella TaxID=5974 RepID=A0A8J8NQQ2_HALGN|nr:hypothetical protein FGO68_gene14078 [Halteria grandinella]
MSATKISDVPTFDLRNIEFMELLGEGAFGKVRLVKQLSIISTPNPEDGTRQEIQLGAVKIMSKQKIIDAQQVDHVYNELSLQQQLKHPFIVNMKGVQQDSRSLYMLMEYVDGGEIFKLINKLGRLPASLARFYTAQMVLCFEYLHSKGFVYRDLKPENVLIHQSGYLKLSDFGFIKRLGPQERTYTICGTAQYMAPEIILNKGHGKAVDWYTLGIFLFELLEGVCPFNHEEPLEMFRMIIQTKLKFPHGFDKAAKSLIRHLTDHDLSKRYGNLKFGVEDIKNHRFFRETNFYQVITQAVQPEYVPEENPLRNKKYIMRQKGAPARHIAENNERANGSAPVKAEEDPFLKWF